jgi:hypothetical protein
MRTRRLQSRAQNAFDGWRQQGRMAVVPPARSHSTPAGGRMQRGGWACTARRGSRGGGGSRGQWKFVSDAAAGVQRRGVSSGTVGDQVVIRGRHEGDAAAAVQRRGSSGGARRARSGASRQQRSIVGMVTRGTEQQQQQQQRQRQQRQQQQHDADGDRQPPITRFLPLRAASMSALSVCHFVDCDAEPMPSGL